MCGFADVDSIPLSERKALAATLSLPVDYAHDVCEIRGVSCANGHVRSIASPKYADLASFQKHNIRVGAASTLKSTQFFCSFIGLSFFVFTKTTPASPGIPMAHACGVSFRQQSASLCISRKCKKI